MGITVVSSSSNGATATGATGITVDAPASIAANDVLYAFLTKDDDVGGDWTEDQVWDNTDNRISTVGRDMNSAVKRRVCGGSEPATYTFYNTDGTEEMAATIIALRGVDTSQPEDISPSQNGGANDDTPSCPDITPASDNCMILAMCALNNSAGRDLITFAEPSGMTLGPVENTNDENAMCGIAYELQGSKTATGLMTWTNTPDSNVAEWHVYSLAIRESVAPETLIVNEADTMSATCSACD